MVAGGVNKHHAGTALAHGLEPKRNDGFGAVGGCIPDVGVQKLQVAADVFFGGVRRERFRKTDTDDAVEGLGAVHAFRGMAIAAAPESLNVERNDLRFGAFDGLAVIERECRDERSFRYFAFGEDDDRFSVQERLVDFFHGRGRIAAVNANQEVPVEEPALVPVGECVAVACDAEWPGRCYLEDRPVNKAEVRTHEKYRAVFGDVLYAHHLDSVMEYEGESKAERRSQKGHRVVLEGCDKA